MSWALLMLVAAAQPPELGIVSFSRGYDAAAARAKAAGKPLVVLFDEVPGCSTVQAFGRDVLSHPLIADALENELVAVVVYNNVPGDDRRVLEAFGEPAWNNPVLRTFTPAARALARVDTGTLAQVTAALVGALAAAGRPVPGYLQLLADETATTTVQRTYAMGCFWEGESTLGKVDGVMHSRPGFVHGHEAVEVACDPRRAAELDAIAKAHGYRAVDGALSFSPGDDKYQLKNSRLRFVPMTALQKSRLNAEPRRAAEWLSERQQRLFERGSRDVLAIDDIVEAYRVAATPR